MLNLQQQMRQNNEDLKKFMKDLDSWEADIKKRDEDLKYQKAVEETVSGFRFLLTLWSKDQIKNATLHNKKITL